MKNILLPTDFSENANNAITYALELFKKEKCNFYLLNTYVPAITHSRFMAESSKTLVVEKNTETSSKNGLKKTIEYIRQKHANPLHSFKTISSFDLLTHEVVDIIKNEHINFVISGTKGITNFKRVFIGANTMHIINAIKDCPVLAIPNNYNFCVPKQLVLATDLKRSLSPEALQALLFITKLYSCTVHILHLKTNVLLDDFQQSNLKIVQNCLASAPLKLHLLPYYANKSEIISRFIKDHAIDTLALVYNNRSYLEELIQEPVVENADYHTKIPLLVLPS
ncbi:universal stress protein [Cellulophaga omnivescoria]|uniref:universal stress protein n=1 Tax=Cellulophaga omnivescoria TaxID=1888890 RepID=UPI0009870214|nr:universal stress protein [Cellulophaga omnivescoria]WBU88233.1 universal stress protein [Cellulophaga omnivescoria]WKB80213.1 universal stress protein [Cellulophaga lytica]